MDKVEAPVLAQPLGRVRALSTGPILGRVEPSVLAQYWPSTGPVLAQCCPVLAQYWPNTGPILAQYWAG